MKPMKKILAAFAAIGVAAAGISTGATAHAAQYYKGWDNLHDETQKLINHRLSKGIGVCETWQIPNPWNPRPSAEHGNVRSVNGAREILNSPAHRSLVESLPNMALCFKGDIDFHDTGDGINMRYVSHIYAIERAIHPEPPYMQGNSLILPQVKGVRFLVNGVPSQGTVNVPTGSKVSVEVELTDPGNTTINPAERTKWTFTGGTSTPKVGATKGIPYNGDSRNSVKLPEEPKPDPVKPNPQPNPGQPNPGQPNPQPNPGQPNPGQPNPGKPAPVAPTTPKVGSVDRYSGPSRVDTSVVNWSKRMTPTIVLAGYFGTPDALVGGTLAQHAGGQVVYVKDRLHPMIDQATANGTIKKVFVVGDGTSVPYGIDQLLRSRGVEVIRLEGPTRYETADAINKYIIQVYPNAAKNVVLATGDVFADALVATPVASYENALLVLTKGSSLTPGTKALLDSHNFGKKLAIGSDAVAVGRAKYGNVIALAGPDRYDTCAAVLQRYAPNGVGFAAMVSGVSDPDASVAGPTAFYNRGLVVLSKPDYLPASIKPYIKNTTNVVFIGGQDVIANVVH